MATDGRLPTLAVPGKILGPATHYVPGPGTHVHNNQVVSSLLGRVTLSTNTRAGPAKRLTKITAPRDGELPTVSVARGERSREVLPDVGAVVLCRVIRLMTKQAIVSIQQVGATVLETEWQGVIRSQDVRATEKDKVKIYESFRPGDTVRAQVVSPLPPLVLLCRVARGHVLTVARSRWVTRQTTTSPRRRTSWVSSWRRARLGTTWCR